MNPFVKQLQTAGFGLASYHRFPRTEMKQVANLGVSISEHFTICFTFLAS